MRVRLKQMTMILGLILLLVTPAWGIDVGDPVPDLSLPTFDGETITTQKLLGRPSLLVFWNTWCAVCMHELPQIDKLNASLGEKKITVVAINTAINDSEKKARHYYRKNGFDFYFTFDRYFDIGQAFRIRGVPTIFLVDARGIVRDKFSNLPDGLAERIRELHGKALPSGKVSRD